MPYLPTADHDELRAVVRELADGAHRAARRGDRRHAEFPWDLKELLAQQDLLGTCFEERHGGTALDEVAQAILVEEVARADATTSLIPAVQKLGALPDPAGRLGGAEGPIPARASPPGSGSPRSP